MSDEAISAYGLGDDAEHHGAHGVTPLPLRLCVLLIFLGTVAFYGVGYAVFAAFRHLLTVL